MSENLSQLPKEEIYKQILEKEFEGGELPDAIFVLSGSIEFHENQGFRSPSYASGDDSGITGSRARVIAAAEIAKTFPEITIVAMSENKEKSHPSDAEVIEQELVERGVDMEQIELEEESTSTHTELLEMMKMAKGKGWTRIAVLTNDYHIARTSLMLEKLENIPGALIDEEEFATVKEFKQSEVEVRFFSAEDIISNASHHYKALIDKVHESQGYKNRVEREQNGIRQLNEGTYKLRR